MIGKDEEYGKMHAKISDSSENDLECKDLFKNIPPVPKFCNFCDIIVLLENWNWGHHGSVMKKTRTTMKIRKVMLERKTMSPTVRS